MIPALQVTGHSATAPQNAETSAPMEERGFDVVFRGKAGCPDRSEEAEDAASVAAEVQTVTSDVLTLPAALPGADLAEAPEDDREVDPEDEQSPEPGAEALLAVGAVHAEARPSDPDRDSLGGTETERAAKGVSLAKAEAPAAPDALASTSRTESMHVRIKEAPHQTGGVIQRESVIFSAIQVGDTQQAAPEVSPEDPVAEVPSVAEIAAGDDLSDRGEDSAPGSGFQTASRSDRPGVFAASGVVDRNAEQAVLRQLADALVQSRAAHGPAEISLTATELGRLSMMVAQDGGAVSVTLTADRPETLDLLRLNIDLLARDLRDLGFDSLNFSFQQGTDGRIGRPVLGSTIENPPVPEPSMPELSPSMTSTISSAARSSGGLDLRL